MLSLKARIVISSITIFGLVLCAFSILVYQNARQDELTKLESRLESHAIRWQTEIDEMAKEAATPEADTDEDNGTPHAMVAKDFLALGIDSPPGLAVRLLDRDLQTVIADSVLEGLPVSVAQQSLDGSPYRGRFERSGQPYLFIQVPVDVENEDGEDEVGFVVQVAAPTLEMDERLRGLRVLFLLAIPAALILASLASMLLMRVALKPMSEMVATAQRISAENMERIPAPRSRDEVRRLADALNEMMARIEAAFASQRQFVANASHEMRTPLAIIQGELEFARKRIEDVEAGNSVDISLGEIDRLAHMCERLLLLARLESSERRLHLSRVRLDELIAESAQFLSKRAAEKNVAIKLDVTSPVEIDADADLLKSAVRNLLDNAVKYSPAGAVVQVTLGPPPAASSGIRLSVEDSGPGIPLESLPNIFERFYRSAGVPSGESGSGLGLAIVKLIADLHGGTIVAESKQESGTTFTLELPGRNPAM